MRFDEMTSDYKPKQPRKDGEFPEIPAGKYTCRMSRAEIKTKGTNKRLSVAFKIQDGEFKNQLIWHTFWLYTGSDAQRGFQKKKFHELCSALGKLSFNTNGQAVATIGSPDDLARCSESFDIVLGIDEPYTNKTTGELVTPTEVKPQWFNKAMPAVKGGVVKTELKTEEFSTSPDGFGSGNEDLPF